MSDFKKKYGEWALIAGASEGLGAEFAAHLASRGMNLLLLARRQKLLEDLTTSLEERYGVETRWLVVDLADSDLVEKVSAAVSGLEIGMLVYNAAYIPIGDFMDRPLDVQQRVFDVNARGPLLLTHILLGPMCERGRGAILLMSSMAGMRGMPRLAVYSATKAFNSILAEGLWRELKGKGIDVLACCAGAVRTPAYMRSFGREAPRMTDATDIAGQALNALGKGPQLIPGRRNRFDAFCSRFRSRGRSVRKIANAMWGKKT